MVTLSQGFEKSVRGQTRRPIIRDKVGCYAYWIGIFILCLCMTVPVAFAEGRPLSLDDVLRMDGVGTGLADPDGKWLVYEQMRPYDEIGDYSFRTYAFGGKSGHQLWRYNLASGGPPERLPGLDQTPFTWQMGFSPGGQYLTILQYREGRLRLGAYDMNEERAIMFVPVPAFSKTGDHDPVWVSEHELVFTALPEGDLPRFTSVRAHTGAVLTQAWEDAWRGDVVTASEVRNLPEGGEPTSLGGQLVLVDVRTGSARSLADGRFADLRLAPGGRHLAALEILHAPGAETDSSFDRNDRLHRLTLFDLRSGEAREILPGITYYPYTLVWAPDGRRLAGFSWPEHGAPREGRFRVLNLESAQVDVFEHRGLELASERERGWLQRPERALFLGDALAVFARPRPEGPDADPLFSNQDFLDQNLPRADWYALRNARIPQKLTGDLEEVSGVPVHAGPGHITVLSDDGVWRLDAKGGSRKLTPEIAGRWQLVTAGTVATHARLMRADFGETGLFTVSGPQAQAGITVSLGDTDAGRYMRVNLPPGGELLAASGPAQKLLVSVPDGLASTLQVLGPDGNSGEIAVVNAHLKNVSAGTWRSVSYVFTAGGQNGEQHRIESCVLLPPGYDGRGRLPLVVEVYPDIPSGCEEGTPDQIGDVSPVSPYLWAGRGVAYVRLSTPIDLMRSPDGPLTGLPGLIEAGAQAIIQEGIADPDRLMLYGFSQGGISALFVSAYTERFKGVIAMNSWADLFSDYFGPLGLYSYVYGERFGANALRYDLTVGSEFGIGKSAFEAPEDYHRNSPVFLARQIDIPVLLVHSDMDAFPMSQFDEMYGALKHAGKDVRYVRYWGEGHGPSSPANIRDLWRRWDAFLNEHGAAPDPLPASQ